ncbi:MAG TPA: hypothetical protein VM597_28690 [Gemmataceae bacterium]|jgi:hypothetical protein|nr:hypothetical protein [Gemmataceae bacterium]
MAITTGRVLAEAGKAAIDGSGPGFRGPTRDALVLRKLQEMRRELDRLQAAIQSAERAVAAGTAAPYAMDPLRGWVATLVESQEYIDSFGFGYGKFPVEWTARQVAAGARRRAEVDRLLASCS